MHDQDQSCPTSVLVDHQACLPQRSIGFQATADQAGRNIQQLAAPAWRRPGLLAQVLIEAEVRIVHPDRPPASQRWPVQLLTQSGNRWQPRVQKFCMAASDGAVCSSNSSTAPMFIGTEP